MKSKSKLSGATMLARALAITATAFIKKKDKGGKPYMLHCLHVMHKVGHTSGDEELMCIAVMHDLVEDTDWTIDALRAEGFSHRVLSGVAAMTHADDVSYDDYIAEIAVSDDARAVKLADLKHNSDITRMKGLRDKDFARLEKYHRAYAYLSK